MACEDPPAALRRTSVAAHAIGRARLLAHPHKPSDAVYTRGRPSLDPPRARARARSTRSARLHPTPLGLIGHRAVGPSSGTRFPLDFREGRAIACCHRLLQHDQHGVTARIGWVSGEVPGTGSRGLGETMQTAAPEVRQGLYATPRLRVRSLAPRRPTRAPMTRAGGPRRDGRRTWVSAAALLSAHAPLDSISLTFQQSPCVALSAGTFDLSRRR